MNILIFFIVLTAAIGGEFLTIYLSYLPVSRRSATQKQMLHTSFVVTSLQHDGRNPARIC